MFDSVKNKSLLVCILLSTCLYSFNRADQIQQIAQWKTNYTVTEQKLWNEYGNTTLSHIYQQHAQFFHNEMPEIKIFDSISIQKNFDVFIEKINRKWGLYREWLDKEKFDVIEEMAEDTLAQMRDIMSNLPMNRSKPQDYLEYFVNVSVNVFLHTYWYILFLTRL